jgi:hypothetical protein
MKMLVVVFLTLLVSVALYKNCHFLAVGAVFLIVTTGSALLVMIVYKYSLTATAIPGVLAQLCRTFRPSVHIYQLRITPIIIWLLLVHEVMKKKPHPTAVKNAGVSYPINSKC